MQARQGKLITLDYVLYIAHVDWKGPTSLSNNTDVDIGRSVRVASCFRDKPAGLAVAGDSH